MPHPKFSMFGITDLDVAVNDPISGLPKGLTGALAAGAITGMYPITGVQSAGLTWGQPQVVSSIGNAGLTTAVMIFPPTDIPQGSLEGMVKDMALDVALQGIKKVTEGALSLYVMGGREAEYKGVSAILTGKAYYQSSVGQPIYWGYIIPRMQLAVMASVPMPQREEVKTQMQMIVGSTDHHLWGKAFSLAVEGVTIGQLIPWAAAYPLACDTLVGDGTTASFTLLHTPVGDHAAAEQVIFAYDYTAGAAIAPTTGFTVVPSTRGLTFQSGHLPGEQHEVCVYYLKVPNS